MSRMKAHVQFDYKAEAPDELSLQVGDVLLDIKQVEDGWCEGTINGKRGMFPDNFVKIVSDTTPAATKLVQSKKNDEPIRKMKAMFSYDPENEDELKLEVGDIIDVLLDEEDGWARGRLNGKEGVFPTNFAELYVVEDPPTSNKVKGVGFGNIFSKGPIKLKQSSFNETDQKVPVVDKGSANKAQKIETKEKTEKPLLPVSESKPKPAEERCRVVHSYDAQTADELTLAKGDIIVVTNKNSGDAGWWEGEVVDNNGRKRHGVFPDNFVVLMPSTDNEVKEKISSDKPLDVTAVEKKAKKSFSEADVPSSNIKPTPDSNLTATIAKPPLNAPPLSSPHSAEETFASAETPVVTSQDSELSHYRRTSGPKNRRRPDSITRRERAKEAPEEPSIVSTDDMNIGRESEPAEPEPEVHKKEAKIGIQVMPSPIGGSEAGETPSWLKNLKSRSSQKKPDNLVLSPHKEETPNETPDWLSNLRKKPATPVDKPASPAVVKPPPHIISPKPTLSGTNHAPARPSNSEKQPDNQNNKQWHVMKPSKSKSEPDVLASSQIDISSRTKSDEKVRGDIKPEIMKPIAASQPPKPSDGVGKKLPVGVKPRPPPPKSKPAIPPTKPTYRAPPPSDDLKEEIKVLKQMMTDMREENKKEMARLSEGLADERKQRQSLQAAVSQLHKQLDTKNINENV